ncbi:MAG: lipopolysaccharide biosynthesis protein [Ignavibacteria bacterium]
MSPSIRSLASDTVVYGVSTVVSRFLTFLLTPLFTNYLTKHEVGEVSGIYAMIAFVNIVYSLGMEPAFMRFWQKGNEENNARVFSVAYWTVALLGVVVTGLTMVFAGPIASSSVLQLGEGGSRYIMLAACIPLLDALVLIPFARLRMLQRPRDFALLRLLSVVVTFTFTILFVAHYHWRIEGALLGGIIGSFATLLAFIPSTLGTLGTPRTPGSWKPLLKSMLSFGLPTVPSNFSSIMVQVADRPIMLMLTSASVVGMYQTNFRLAIPMMMFVTVFEYAWKPFYLNHRDEPDAKELFARVFTVFTAVCGGIFLITSFFIEYIVRMPFIGGRFINQDYWEGMTIIPIVMVAYFFNGVFINMAAGLHIQKRTGFFPLATGVAALVSVVATWLLVPSYGIIGAAWAKVVAYLISAIMLYIFAQRVYPVKYQWGTVGLIAAAAGIAYMVGTHWSGDVVALAVRLVAFVAFVVTSGRILGKGLASLKSIIRR